MIKRMKRKEEDAHIRINVELPDGRRVLLPAPAFGLATRYGMIKAQLPEEERLAFDVVSLHAEYAAIEKGLRESTVLTKVPPDIASQMRGETDKG